MEQKTAAWVNERAQGIGGSEIAILLGTSPFRTPYDLWLEKTGQKIPADISNQPHVMRGVLGEKVCRMILEREMLHSFKPKTWRIEGTPWRCSDDGYSEDLGLMLEIKCMGRENHEKALKGEVPEYYRVQCQYNMAVSGVGKCLFVSFKPETEEMAKIEMAFDHKEGEYLKAVAKRFWDEHVVARVPPELTDKDYVKIESEEFERQSIQYIQLKKQIEELNQVLTEIESKLKAHVDGHPAIMGKRIRINKTKRKGAIDYAAAIRSGLGIEQFRKEPIEVVRIMVLDELR